MQGLPECLQSAIEAIVQILTKLRFMLIVGNLTIIGKHTLQDLLCFQRVQHLQKASDKVYRAPHRSSYLFAVKTLEEVLHLAEVSDLASRILVL